MNKHNRCISCVVDRSKCIRCRENPIYDDIPTQSLYQSYISTCPNYSEWYKELYGGISPEQASEQSCRKRLKEDSDEKYYYYYDNEDK